MSFSLVCSLTFSTAWMRVCLSFWLIAAMIASFASAFTRSTTPSASPTCFHSILSARALGEQFLLHRDEFLDAALRDAERLDDVLFLDLDGAALDHHDGLLRARDDEVHVGELERLERGIEHPLRRAVLARHAADAHAGDRARERDARGVQRERGRDEREHVGLVLLVGGDDVDEDLDLVLEAFGEERADGAVDDAAREDLLVARAALTLDEAARDLAGGVGLLLVLDGEREERERGLLVAHRDGREDHRVAELHEAGTGGLLGHAARLDDQGPARERPLDAIRIILGIASKFT